jgi:hypothetical protein
MNLYCFSWANALTAAEFIALRFVRHPADLVLLINKQYFLRTELHARPTPRTQLLINNHNLIHKLTFHNADYLDQFVGPTRHHDSTFFAGRRKKLAF